MATVFGQIKFEDGTPAAQSVIRAYDKDSLRTEQLLGEITTTAGSYQISYGVPKDEIKHPDLIVRGFDQAGNLRAESDIVFNAPDQLQIDLIVAATVPPTRTRSELEALQADIEPLRSGVSYQDFTDSDIDYLAEELGTATADPFRARLGALRRAAQYEIQTRINRAAFYGWFADGLSTDLDELIDIPLSHLRLTLERTIQDNIIPDITDDIANILERIQALRFENGRLVSHRFVAQLIDDQTNQELDNVLIDVLDLDAETDEQEQGTITADGQGVFILNFVLPGNATPNATPDAARRLQLTIRDEDRTLASIELNAVPHQTEVIQISVPIQLNEQEQIPINSIASADLSSRLHSQAISTLGDLLANPDLTDDDTEALETLRNTAKLAILNPELSDEQQTYFLDNNLASPLDIARSPRAKFVNTHRQGLGSDAEAYAAFQANLDIARLFEHQMTNSWLDQFSIPDDDDDPDIPTGVKETIDSYNHNCGCKDCTSAVSPAAYLAHLLDWVLTHLKDGNNDIAFASLERDLHQPFGDLPASCDAVETEVPQVRLVVESLWNYTGLREKSDLQMPTPFRKAYRHLRNQLYTTILQNLGVSFEQLRRAVLTVEGETLTAEQVAAQRIAVASILGIDEAHLQDLYFNVELYPISPDEEALEQLFGFQSTRRNPFAEGHRPDLIHWQQEQLESLWQSQDWRTDAYSGNGRLPFIDPGFINQDDLRTPLAANPAFALLTARQELLASHRQSMVDSNPQRSGLAGLKTLLMNELKQTIAQLQTWFEGLQSGSNPAKTEAARTEIEALNLTLAGFSYLMGIYSQLLSGESLGNTEAEIEAVWEDVFDILSRAYRHGQFPLWIEEENDAGILLGSKLFWLPLEQSAPPNPWQAHQQERLAWEEALQNRNQRPIIDPDQIPQSYISIVAVVDPARAPKEESQAANVAVIDLSRAPKEAIQGFQGIHSMGKKRIVKRRLTAFRLWQERRNFIDERLGVLQAARQDAETTLDAFAAMLTASTTGIDLQCLLDLREQEAAGQDIMPRLTQLNLSLPAYRFLADVHMLTEAGVSISKDRWDPVEAILTQAEKQLEFAGWHIAEQSLGVTLHPNQFSILSPPDPIATPIGSEWLHDAQALNRWVATLAARKEQLDALDAALATAVGDAAAQILPLLRNILVMETVAPGDTLAAKADWLDKRLLMDMFMDGCQKTTRVSHAIETLQRLVRGVYTLEHIKQLEHLTLDAIEDYEHEWPVMGTYATWRAYMLAYLFPENLLHISPPSKQSYGFAQLKKKLPSRLTPDRACAAVKEYADYFQDICTLEVQASCQVDNIGYAATHSTSPSLVHVFALAASSNTVYTATFDGKHDKKDMLSTWHPVPKLNNVIEIIGAVPHNTSQGRRLIVLFVKVRERSKNKLELIKYDFDSLAWGKPGELDLPPGTAFDFSAVAVQKRYGNPGDGLAIAPVASAGSSGGAESVPTILAIRAPNGRIYVRSLNSKATYWAGGEWIPLFGSIHAENYVKICALIQRSSHEYLAIVQDRHGWLKYRIFSTEPVMSKDDGHWRTIAEGDFAGAFAWPDTPDVFVFYVSEDKTKYAIVNQTNALVPGGWLVQTPGVLEAWLVSAVGVSLTSFILNFDAAFQLHNESGGVLDGVYGSGTYAGNLLKLLELTVQTWDFNMPEEADESKAEILKRFQKKGLDQFLQVLKALPDISFHDSALGKWKLADWYVRQFADGKGLASVVEDVFNQKSTTFRIRSTPGEKQIVDTITAEKCYFVPSGGDEAFGPLAQKTVVLRQHNGAFRLKFKRSVNGKISMPALRRITLNGDGAYDLTPLSSRDDLQSRRFDIKTMYARHGGRQISPVARLYLREAYNLVPIYLGFALQRNGFYEEALLWYRQVFDYLQSTNKQKIDRGLQLERKFSLDRYLAEAFLDDAGNAHAIAATRKNSYTRHILLTIIRCLIDYADALFARDNVNDNARARELYTQALKLLNSKALKPGQSSCANILGALEVEVVPPGYLFLQAFFSALEEIPNEDDLAAVVSNLRAINQDTNRSALERLESMQDVVVAKLAEVPGAKSQSAIYETRQEILSTLEKQALASPSMRGLLEQTHRQRYQSELLQLAEIAGDGDEPVEGKALPWLRQPRSGDGDESQNSVSQNSVSMSPDFFARDVSSRRTALNQMRRSDPLAYLAMARPSNFAINTGISFEFCIPQNPVIQALRRRAENNLTKLRTCRNIAGFIRQLDPYGAPIGLGSGLVSPDGKIFSGVVDAPPTPYRYAALVARAKEFVNIAQQIEAGYQNALVSAEGEALTLLQAEQSVELAEAQVTLNDLHLDRANSELGLAELQQESAILREETYAGWMSAGQNEHEKKMLVAYQDAGQAQASAAIARATGQALNAAASAIPGTLRDSANPATYVKASLLAGVAAAAIAEGAYNVQAIQAQTQAQTSSALASFERRHQEWQLQHGLAAQDILIGKQQIRLAQDGIAIAAQERVIAGLQQTHAVDILEFLHSKTFTEEMYRWIASILEEVYRYFLQEAASIARLAGQQLAFERQQGSLKLIQSEYWNIPLEGPGQEDKVDRLGLTGAARLLKDIYQLDQYAFETRQLKQNFSVTLDLAELFPFEFQQFRETGVLVFETSQSLIDRQFPGYYLCLIQQVSVAVVALIPPTYGIRASLTSAGISQTVGGGDVFQAITIRQLPERLPLTAATTTSSGPIELEPDAQSLQRPFEGSGFATQWELRMPKANNLFDYNTMATVLFTVQLTALHSFDYERQVLEQLDRNLSANRAFRFRNEFADAWYDLNNPDLTDTPMAVRFQTRREDFPPNVEDLRIQHLLLYFVRRDRTVEEVPVQHLHFTPQGSTGVIGGGATTIDGIISSRRGNGTNWLPAIGQVPFGDWELALSDDLPVGQRPRELFEHGIVEDILLVITWQGQTPAWPV